MSNSTINNGLSGISFFASPQLTDEGYGSGDNQERYLTALETDVSFYIARCMEIMSLFVNFVPFANLQEENGAKFPRYLRINDTMPTRGSAYSYAQPTNFDRPSTYERSTVWAVDSLKRSLWQEKQARALTDAQYNAEYDRVIKSFVQFIFQEVFVELALYLKKEHFQFYKDSLVSQMMVEQFNGLNAFATRGETPSDVLKGILNRILTNIDNFGAVILAHDVVLSNLNLMTETKYETTVSLLMDKMRDYDIVPFKQGFLEGDRQLLMNRLPTASQNNVTIEKYISHFVVSPIVIVPLSAFDGTNKVCAAGADNHRLYELFLDGLAAYNAQANYAATVPTVATAAAVTRRRTDSQTNATAAKAAGFAYVAFILPENAVIGATMATAVMPKDKAIMPVTLYITPVHDGDDKTEQGGTRETVIRQALCAGNTNFQGTCASPCAKFFSSDSASATANDLKPWQTDVYDHQKVLLTSDDMSLLDKSAYGKNGVYFKHLGLDSKPDLAERLFNAKRFASLTEPTISKEYSRRGLDDIPCELYYQSSNFMLTRLPVVTQTGATIATSDENVNLHSLLMNKPLVEKDKILSAASFNDLVAF